MLKKLEYDAIAADLAAVDALLAESSMEDDPIGFRQFTHRQQALQSQLHVLQQQGEHCASIGLFFGGGPVQGSRGIHADFAGAALSQIQAMISTRYTELESGPLNLRGKLPQSTRADMVLTQIVRGSIGFVLEEANDNQEILATPLKIVVGEISQLLIAAGEQDANLFEQACELLDARILSPLNDFFVLLDKHEAQVRIVCGAHDVQLSKESISLARERVQALEIQEDTREFSGNLYFRPGKKDFELHTDHQEMLDGKVLSAAAAQLSGQQEVGAEIIDPKTISLHRWRVLIKVKQIRTRNRVRTSYALHSLLGLADELAH